MKQVTGTTKKINWLLILQGWAMLWVVIGHAPLRMDEMPGYVSCLYNFAYSFHMPLFILVSGYLFQLTRLSKCALSDRGGYISFYKTTVEDKLLRLGIPYLLFTVIAMGVKALFPGDMERQTDLSLHELLIAIVDPGKGPLGEMWFILTIFWYFFLAPVWHFFTEKKTRIVIFMAIALFIHFVHPNSSFLCVRHVCYYAIFFYSGILICKGCIVNKIIERKYWLMLFGLLLYILSYYLQFPLGVAFGAIVFSAGLAFMFDDKIPNLFSSFRNYTYQIFLMGIFFFQCNK